MPDMESVISSAVAASRDSGSLPEVSEAVDSTPEPESFVHDEVVMGSPADKAETAAAVSDEEPVVADPAAPAVVEDAFAKENDLPQPKEGKENRIPYSRVKKIAENAEGKGARTIAEAILGTNIAADKPLIDQVKAHIARMPELETRVQGYESELSAVRDVEKIMTGSPEQFLAILPHVNPKYAELLSGRVSAPATSAATPDAANDPMPGPDFDLGNGAKTYSEQGLADRMAWERRQAKRELREEFAPDLQPLRDQREVQKHINAAAARTVSQVKQAEANWPNFKENADAILLVLQSDRPGKLSLMDAYTQVINKKSEERIAALSTDRNKIRAELLEEMKKAPTATSTVTGAAVAAKEKAAPGTRTTEQVIKDALDRSRR